MSDTPRRITLYLDRLHSDLPNALRSKESGTFELLLAPEAIRAAEETTSHRLKDTGAPSEWAMVGVAFEDQYLVILRDAVRFPDGQLGTYLRILRKPLSGGAAAIMPVFHGQILLVKHFRHATGQWHLEIPRGVVEKHSGWEEAARQELAEEIQGVARRLVHLGTVHPDSGLLAIEVPLIYAELDSYGDVERHEAISQIVLLSVDEFRHCVRTGEITDGFTLAAYVQANLQGFL